MPRCPYCSEKYVYKYNSLKEPTCGKPKCILQHKKLYFENKKQKEVKIYSIPKVSEKRSKLNKVYEVVRIEVLTEAKFKCFVENCNNIAATIEHQRGRIGFFDDLARDNNIPLLIDKRFLKACCFNHNQEFENNTELSKKYQLSKIHKGKK